MATKTHPTRQRLLDTAVELLGTVAPNELTVERVLEESGVSIGSLYHHFSGFPDLVNHALVVRYAEFLNLANSGLRRAVDESSNPDELRENVNTLMDVTHADSYRPIRTLRVWVAAQAAVNPALRELLAAEQARQTAEMAAVIRDAQARGWVRKTHPADVMAVFIQSYTLGRVVDDISQTHVDNTEWRAFMKDMVERTILTVD
ncbi:MAG: TetR/AcrR family transcriptional regulator [Agromyces sp.]